jgi:hypothetical protein
VRALRSDGTVVEEAVSASNGVNDVRRVIDSGRPSFVEYAMGSGRSMVELAPYLIAVNDGKPPADVPNPPGYPLGSPGLPGWNVGVRIHGWETVAVPAGKFRALRVEANGNRAVAIGGQVDFSGRFRLDAWYAPDVNRIVRSEHRVWSQNRMDPRLLIHDIAELVSYRPPS